MGQGWKKRPSTFRAAQHQGHSKPWPPDNLRRAQYTREVIGCRSSKEDLTQQQHRLQRGARSLRAAHQVCRTNLFRVPRLVINTGVLPTSTQGVRHRGQGARGATTTSWFRGATRSGTTCIIDGREACSGATRSPSGLSCTPRYFSGGWRLLRRRRVPNYVHKTCQHSS